MFVDCFTRTVYIVYHNVYRDYFGVVIEQHVFSFGLVVMSMNYMTIYVPIVMYGLKLFVVVLQELHCLPIYLHVGFNRVIGFYHFTKFRCSTPSSF